MGLFEKKYCDICGEKISLLGNRKLEDGNMCSDCAKGISPFMTDRRQTSVAEMKEHLAYREANKQNVAVFGVTETYGDSKKLYIDRARGNFIVSYNQNSWAKENPDVIPLSEISSCNLDIRENREELYTKDAQGNRVSFSPPRYEYYYDFYLKINVSNRWFNEIEMKLNSGDVQGLNTQRYHDYQVMAQQIIAALTNNSGNYGTAYNAGAAYGGASGNQYQQNAYAQQQYQPNGYAQQQYQPNGYAQQQYQQNGYAQQQYQPNGYAQQQYQPNGYAQQQYQQNGYTQQQYQQNVYAQGNAGTALNKADILAKLQAGVAAGVAAKVVCSCCGAEFAQGAAVPKFCSSCGHQIDANDVVTE